MHSNIIERILNKVPYTTSQRSAHTVNRVGLSYA